VEAIVLIAGKLFWLAVFWLAVLIAAVWIVFVFVPGLWIACGAGALALFFFWPFPKAAKDFSRALREAEEKEFAEAFAKTFVAALPSFPKFPDPVERQRTERARRCAENYAAGKRADFMIDRASQAYCA
jgi:hypothetical protein